MTKSEGDPFDSELSPSELVVVERLCDRFEDQRRAGAAVDVNVLLTEAPERARPILLRELLRLDLVYRVPDERDSARREYMAQFPEYALLIEDVFREATAAYVSQGVVGPSPSGPESETRATQLQGAGRSDPAVSGAPTLPGYAVEARLGQGAMGVVYRARQLGLKRVVAIKTTRGTAAEDPRFLIRFLAEAEAAAAIDHPHVARVYDYGECDHRPYIALEYCSGGTLADRLRPEQSPGAPEAQPEGRRLDPREAAILLAKITRGVGAAHSLGIVHRDLKPGNILFDANGEPKVADFGLAKVGAGSDLTQTQALMGTPLYMSPEQAAGRTKFAGPPADVWALGVILYECLTGLRPFRADDTNAVLQAVVNHQPPSPRSLNPAVPRDLDLVVGKCLEKEPRDRYATASELADDLEKFTRGEPVSVRAPGLMERTYKWARRKPTVAGLYAATVLGIIVFAVAVGFAVLSRELWQAQEKLAVIDYGRTVQMAHQAWRDNNVPAALALLESTRPDLRGWEWHYVHRLCHSDLLTLQPQADAFVYSTSFSPDGTRILLKADAVKVLDSSTGAELFTLPRGRDGNFSAAFSPDGSRIVTAQDRTVVVWDAKTGVELFRAKGGDDHTDSACFSQDGRRILAGSGFQAKVWDATTGKELMTLPRQEKRAAHKDRVQTTAFSPDGKRIVTGGWDETVKVWDAETGAELLAIGGHYLSVQTAVFSPDGSEIVTTSSDRIVRVFDAKTGKPIRQLVGHTDLVKSALYSRDGSKIVTASNDRTARIWDAKTGTELRTFKGHTRHVQWASFSPDGSRVVTGSTDHTAKVWDVNLTPEFLALKGDAFDVGTAEFSPDGSRILTTSGHYSDRRTFVGGAARIWDSRTGTELLAITGFKAYLATASFSPDESRVLTVGFRTVDGEWTADEWDSRSGALLRSHRGHGETVGCASYSPDGSRIVIHDSDRKLRILDANSGTELRVLPIARGGSSIFFTPNGAHIVVLSSGRASAWDAQTGNQVMSYKSPANNIIYSVWKGPDGWRALVQGTDNSVPGSETLTAELSLRDLDTDDEIIALKGHTIALLSASLSPDGSRVVTAGGDRTVKIWDAKTGAELLTLKDHTDSVNSATFSPDGWRIVSASRDGTAIIWDATPISRDARSP